MLVASGIYIGMALASILRVALKNQSVVAEKSRETKVCLAHLSTI